jgi:DNA-directed RNA polymerase, mitochondrial
MSDGAEQCGGDVQSALAHELYDTIYFPHNIDFRGRAYPMPPHLNHMGADICRGLLQFSEARPLGANGFRWLLIHLANAYGAVDKQSFDRRMSWSLENLANIRDSADHPLSGKRWWVQAENPWTVLAACTDITAALRSGDVSKYRSRLPVHQDGSCNGLQHYAALGRDTSGAEAVNLVDAPQPQDVYGVVADKLAKLVADEAAGSVDNPHSQHARSLLGHTDRKLVKQTVMTTVYGVTMRGARDQVANRCEMACFHSNTP